MTLSLLHLWFLDISMVNVWMKISVFLQHGEVIGMVAIFLRGIPAIFRLIWFDLYIPAKFIALTLISSKSVHGQKFSLKLLRYICIEIGHYIWFDLCRFSYTRIGLLLRQPKVQSKSLHNNASLHIKMSSVSYNAFQISITKTLMKWPLLPIYIRPPSV